MKQFLIAIFVAGFIAGFFVPAFAEQPCRSLPALLTELASKAGETTAAEATDERGLRIVFTASAGGSWSMVVVLPNKCAGIVASGQDWTHRKIPAPEVARDFHLVHGAFDWIMNDPNPAIASCCGPADCEHVKTGDIEATGAGWFLKETGEVIPFDKTFPSKDGQVARCRFLATGKTRCLFIPPGGS